MYFGNSIKSKIDSYLTYEAYSPVKTNNQNKSYKYIIINELHIWVYRWVIYVYTYICKNYNVMWEYPQFLDLATKKQTLLILLS